MVGRASPPPSASGRCGRSWPCRSPPAAPLPWCPERREAGQGREPPRHRRLGNACTPCRSLASVSPSFEDTRRRHLDRLAQSGRRHLAIGLLDEARDQLPVETAVDARPHPAPRAYVRRPEEPLGIQEDQRLLLAERRGQPVPRDGQPRDGDCRVGRTACPSPATWAHPTPPSPRSRAERGRSRGAAPPDCARAGDSDQPEVSIAPAWSWRVILAESGGDLPPSIKRCYGGAHHERRSDRADR